jgi:DNA-binding NtrC family response regulator
MNDWDLLSLEFRAWIHHALRSLCPSSRAGICLVSEDTAHIICGIRDFHPRGTPCLSCDLSLTCEVAQGRSPGRTSIRIGPPLHAEGGRDGLPPYRLVGIDPGTGNGPQPAGAFEGLAQHVQHTWSRWCRQEEGLEELTDFFRMAYALCDLSSQAVTPAEVAAAMDEGLTHTCHIQNWLILLKREDEWCVVASPRLKAGLDGAGIIAQMQTVEKVRIGDLALLGHENRVVLEGLITAFGLQPPGEILLLPLDRSKAEKEPSRPPTQWLVASLGTKVHPPGPLLDRMRVFCHLGLAAWEVARRAEEAKERERRVQKRETLVKQSIRSLPGFDALVGESAVMEELREAILRAAKSDRTVLLVGEQGTGKELAAKLIHRHSDQGNFRFICRRVAAEIASGFKLWKSFYPSAKSLEEMMAKEFRDVPFVRIADFSKHPKGPKPESPELAGVVADEESGLAPQQQAGWKPKDPGLAEVITEEEGRLLSQHRYLYRSVLRRLHQAWQQNVFFNFFEYDSGAAATEYIASELFGFADKRFTDTEGGPGRFQTASHCGGTLFLDNIHHLDLSVQRALLKATEVRHEDRRVSRAGVAGAEPVHIRIIAATTTDLRELAAEKKFLYELASRLMCEVIPIPPLNSRREDIPLLAAHFAQSRDKELEPGAVEPLRAVDWHGMNVRGLQNIVESAAQTDQPVITAKAVSRAMELLCSQVLKEPLNKEQIMIREAMERTSGNVQQTAKDIGWSRQKLYRLLKHYDIDRLDFLGPRKSEIAKGAAENLGTPRSQ